VFAAKAELDGLPHLLLHHVDVVVVQVQVPHTILDQPEKERTRSMGGINSSTTPPPPPY
jgi:hypothetical protein